jgi:hypothetical protein
MKRIILLLFLLITFKSLSQDTITSWQPTQVFANHNKYKNHLLDILYSKKLNIIVDMVKTKGFNGFYYLKEYYGVDLKINTPPDSIYNSLNDFAKDLPKNRTKVNVSISESSFLSELTSFEEYTYIKGETTYFIRFVYINAQMNGIYLNIRSKY